MNPAILILLNILAQADIDPNKFNHFMLLGYVVMWLIMMVYIVTLVNRQRNVKQDLELLSQLLTEDEKSENK